MKKLLFGLFIITWLVSACYGGPQTTNLVTTEERTEDISQPVPPPLIPREVLFGNPDKVSVQLSPDGARISYLAPLEGVLNVWVGPADDPAAARPVTNDLGRGIRAYFWAYTSNHILYIQDKEGDENWRIYSVDLTSDEIKDLTPLEGVQARIYKVSPNFPDEIVVGLNDRTPQLHDLYHLNIETGERRIILENQEFIGFVMDDDYNIRAAMRLTPDGGSEYLTPTKDGGWESYAKVPMEDLLTTGPVTFDKTGETLYIIDSRGRNTSGLFALDLETGEQILIAEDPRTDVSDLMVHPTEKTVQAVAFTYERKRWQVVDEAITEDLAYLRTVADGDVEVTDRTLDDKFWIVAYLLDDGPVHYFYYDREAQQAQFLFTHRSDLEDLALTKMHPVVIESGDGLNLVSYYSLPIESDSDGDARPDEPLPLVLLVHGGPWFRDNWGYNSLHQMLANRGYAVLSVNFRASTGFGKAFINAGNLEWGGKMHDDLIDAVEWAIQERIADPERVAIMGGSYGGYATLWGMTATPERFACGVDLVGISNLVTWMDTIPPYWTPQIELFATRIGDHRTEEGRAFLTERSPLTYVDQIEKPLLIGQGVNDPRVPQAESDQIVQAMQAKGLPVTYVLYPDEGHGFARPENNLSFFAVTDAFLAECLSGRYEPIGDDFAGSSINVPVGAEEIPGLTEALAELPPTPTAEPAPPLTEVKGEAMDTDLIQTFEQELERLREELNIPGMSVAVVHDQEVVLARGFGYADIENEIAATESTAYEIASLTKPFAAAVIMQLVEAGQLDLDAEMADILQDVAFTFPPPAAGTIDGYANLCQTILELSKATSGPFAPMAFLFQDYHCDTEPITVRHHLTHTAQEVPGENYRYNGFLYGLLSWVVEKATGQAFDELLVERIIAPLEMTNTIPSWSNDRRQQLLAEMAKPYQTDEAGNIVLSDYQPNGYVNAAAGMISTVLDLAKFDVAMDRNLIVSEKSKGAMFTPTLSNSGQPLPYGMGWFVQEEQGAQLIWHYGWEQAYSSLILKVPEAELTLILLANSDGASAPFNLGAGNVLKSPFAVTFINLFTDIEVALP